jgi:hypothetical protein
VPPAAAPSASKACPETAPPRRATKAQAKRVARADAFKVCRELNTLMMPD